MEPRSIIAAFNEKVRENPAAIAIIDELRTLTREKLWHLSGGIAAKLPDGCRRVGIVMDHGAAMIAAIFAVLRRGATYVPVEPFFPKERIQFMFQDAEIDAVITQSAYQTLAGEIPAYLVERDYEAETDADDTLVSEDEEGAAYILYTSGTTGQPKGIAVTNGNVLHYVRAFQREFQPGEKDIMLQYSVCSFDIFVEEVFTSLLSGAALAIPAAGDRENIRRLMDFVARCQVTILSGFPYLLQEMNGLPALPPSLRLLISGGDVLREAYVDRLVDKITVYNTYGPSETTVCAAYYNCSAGYALDDGSYPVGKPVQGTEILLLDEHVREVPPGVTGEICILGNGVSLGYIGGRDKENEAFITCSDGRRMYRSGDLGYWLSDGNIAFLRRKDTQVMIYGKRVETGEVENVLLRSGLLRQAYVCAAIDENQLSYMIAYIVMKNATTTISQVRAYLAKYLADFMIPEFFVELPSLPLTPNGKVDKKALPVPRREIAKIRAKGTVIETLAASDIELLLELRMEVLSHVFSEQRQEISEEEWNLLKEENRRYYLAELAQGGHIACIAREGETIVGCGGVCLYREMPSPDNLSGKCGYLMNIYTRKPYRKNGVARKMCKWLIQKAKEKGAEKIYLETSEAAKGLYYSLGFREMKGYLKLENGKA